MLITTLCYIEHKNHYLMLHRTKKSLDINEGKWIGVGGKFIDRESPEECLLREVREETGYQLKSWRFRGFITFLQENYETEYMCLYTATGWQFWIAGAKRGWFDSRDGMLHAANLAVENSLRLAGGWLLTGTDGFGVRWTGG